VNAAGGGGGGVLPPPQAASVKATLEITAPRNKYESFELIVIIFSEQKIDYLLTLLQNYFSIFLALMH
jgi:hypothetical protein